MKKVWWNMAKSKPRVAIVNYGMGNLFSVQQTCAHVGLEAVVTNQKRDLQTADGIILPGVGAFGDAMDNLNRLDITETLQKAILSEKKPFLGVCLGLQLLMEESEEFGYHRGLGVVKGKVIRFGDQIKGRDGRAAKVPQVGWNQIYPTPSGSEWSQSLLSGVSEGDFMYFVHSYHIEPEDRGVRLSMTRYGNFEFCSSVQKGNIFGCQFHPERSGAKGVTVYQNFLKLFSKS